MSVDPESNETVELSEEMARRRSRLNPDDLIGPSCMYWAMIAMFVVLGGMIIVWAISHIGTIGQ